jgi:hypothetical protein
MGAALLRASANCKIDARGCHVEMLACTSRKNRGLSSNTSTSLQPRHRARRKGLEGRKVIAEVVRPRLTIDAHGPAVQRTDTRLRPCTGPPGLPAPRRSHHRPDGRCYFLSALGASHRAWRNAFTFNAELPKIAIPACREGKSKLVPPRNILYVCSKHQDANRASRTLFETTGSGRSGRS